MVSLKSSEGSTGFGGNKYSHTIVSEMAFSDVHDDFLKDFLFPSLVEAFRVLKKTGTLYLHLDWRYSHYAKVFLDSLMGKESFLNSLIWCYNWGGRGKKCWPKKHDDILVYVKNPNDYTFNWDDIDRIPYKAPELQKDPARAARGQVPPDWWDLQIIGTSSNERVGYPTQKPLKLVERIIKASSNKNDVVLDYCAGSGTTLIAAAKLERSYVGIDISETSHRVIKERFQQYGLPEPTFKTIEDDKTSDESV
jgi:site-specific DNA-methyltransferase (adenine-specific)